MLVTDSDMLDSLIGIARIPEDQMSGVLYAGALVAHKNIYSLGGTYDGNGVKKEGFPYTVAELNSFNPGSHPVSSEGLTNGTVRKAYVGITSGIPAALTSIVPLSKKPGDSGTQAKSVVDRTEAWLTKRYDAWNAKSMNIDVYLDGQALSEMIKVAPSLKEQSKALANKLKEAAKESGLKGELAAYSAYCKLGSLAFSNKESERNQAKSGLDQIAAKFSDTAYGRQSKVVRQAMDAPKE